MAQVLSDRPHLERYLVGARGDLRDMEARLEHLYSSQALMLRTRDLLEEQIDLIEQLLRLVPNETVADPATTVAKAG